jgi:hypothetical protein
VVVAIVVVVSAVVWAGTRGGGGRSAEPAGGSAPAGPAAELAGLASRAATTFDVVYTVSDPRLGPTTAHQWRRGPLGRLDTESGQGDSATSSVQVLSTSGPVACSRTGTMPWSCAPKPGLKLADVGVVPAEVVASLSKLSVSVGDDRIAGQAVRCFTVTDPTVTTTTAGAITTGELCLTSDGVPLRLVAGSTHIEAVSFSRIRPPDSVFKPPAGP